MWNVRIDGHIEIDVFHCSAETREPLRCISNAAKTNVVDLLIFDGESNWVEIDSVFHRHTTHLFLLLLLQPCGQQRYSNSFR